MKLADEIREQTWHDWFTLFAVLTLEHDTDTTCLCYIWRVEESDSLKTRVCDNAFALLQSFLSINSLLTEKRYSLGRIIDNSKGWDGKSYWLNHDSGTCCHLPLVSLLIQQLVLRYKEKLGFLYKYQWWNNIVFAVLHQKKLYNGYVVCGWRKYIRLPHNMPKPRSS